MNLFKRLSKLNNEDFIYLGCKSSSGFFFIGTYENFKKILLLIRQKALTLDWGDLTSKKIIYEYERETNIPGTVFIINGRVAGGYWFYDEFINGIKKSRKANAI